MTTPGAAKGEVRGGPPPAAAGVRPLYATSRVGGADPSGRPPSARPHQPRSCRPVPAHVSGAGSKSNGASGRRLPHGGGSNEQVGHSPAASTLPPQPSRAARDHLRSQSRLELTERGTGTQDTDVPPSSRENSGREKCWAGNGEVANERARRVRWTALGAPPLSPARLQRSGSPPACPSPFRPPSPPGPALLFPCEVAAGFPPPQLRFTSPPDFPFSSARGRPELLPRVLGVVI